MSELTPEANRAARALVGWSIRDLAREAGLNKATVHRFESLGRATAGTRAKMVAAFAAVGVHIIDEGGTGAMLVRDGADPVAVEPDEKGRTVADDAAKPAGAVPSGRDEMQERYGEEGCGGEGRCGGYCFEDFPGSDGCEGALW